MNIFILFLWLYINSANFLIIRLFWPPESPLARSEDSSGGTVFWLVGLFFFVISLCRYVREIFKMFSNFKIRNWHFEISKYRVDNLKMSKYLIDLKNRIDSLKFSKYLRWRVRNGLLVRNSIRLIEIWEIPSWQFENVEIPNRPKKPDWQFEIFEIPALTRA